MRVLRPEVQYPDRALNRVARSTLPASEKLFEEFVLHAGEPFLVPQLMRTARFDVILDKPSVQLIA